MKKALKGEKTITHIHEQWRTMAKTLKQWEIRLIEMRSEGIGFPEISERLKGAFKIKGLNFTNHYMRECLMFGGRLRIPFEIYGDMISKEYFEEGRQTIMHAHSVAASTLLALLSPKQSGATRLGAANSILDRNAGKAVQAEERQDNDAIEELRQKLKGIIERDSETIQNRVAKIRDKKIRKNK